MNRYTIISFVVIFFGLIILLAELFNLRESIPINLNSMLKKETCNKVVTALLHVLMQQLMYYVGSHFLAF